MYLIFWISYNNYIPCSSMSGTSIIKNPKILVGETVRSTAVGTLRISHPPPRLHRPAVYSITMIRPVADLRQVFLFFFFFFVCKCTVVNKIWLTSVIAACKHRPIFHISFSSQWVFLMNPVRLVHVSRRFEEQIVY